MQSPTETPLAASPGDKEDALWGPEDLRISSHFTFCPGWQEVSPWSRSAAKRFFDCACVLLALPFLVPMLLVIAAAVRLTSRGPVLFTQKRMGRHGRAFTSVQVPLHGARCRQGASSYHHIGKPTLYSGRPSPSPLEIETSCPSLRMYCLDR